VQRGLRIDLEMENDKRLFYRHRARFNELIAQRKDDTSDAAALFYFLNRTGYNGLCRFNKGGEFNVPFGQYGRVRYMRDFDAYRGVLASCALTSVDVEAVPLDSVGFANGPRRISCTGARTPAREIIATRNL
jgi:DNA adenine methylase